MSRREWTPASTQHVSELRATVDGHDAPAEELASFVVEHLEGGVVLQVAGEIDMLTTPRLRDLLDTLVKQQPPSIILDLAAVTFFASSGLAALVAAREAAVAAGVPLRLAAVSRSVRRPLQITGLAGRFECYDDVPAALAP